MNIQTRNLLITDDNSILRKTGQEVIGVCQDQMIQSSNLSFLFHSFYSVPNKVFTTFSFGIEYKTFDVTELYVSNGFVAETATDSWSKIPFIKELRATYPQLSLLCAKQIIDNFFAHSTNILKTFSAQEKFSSGRSQLPYLPYIIYYDRELFYVYSRVEYIFNPYIFFYHPLSGYCCIISNRN